MNITKIRARMIQTIRTLSDAIFSLLKDDPVRPKIPHSQRIGKNKDIFVLRGIGEKVTAITCVSYQNFVPTGEFELFSECDDPNIAIFYTIWSYAPGSGRRLIFEALDSIQKDQPKITRFLTLSPKSEMAEKFHLRNGAKVFRVNDETINYEYSQ
jgi:hypothetical protein